MFVQDVKAILLAAFIVAGLPTASLAEDQPTAEQAIEIAKSLGPDDCSLRFETEMPENMEPEKHAFDYKYEYNDTANHYVLYRVPCWMAAYNQGDAWVLFDGDGGGKVLSFAAPSYDVTFEDPGENTKVKSITITGYTTQSTLGFTEFDPKTREISFFMKSRGLGDASTNGTWRFEDGEFVLKTYDVDASYNGEIDSQNIVSFPPSQENPQ